VDRRRDLDSAHTMERENEELEMKLNRARAPPSNISTLLPPEILGNIFHWTMIFQREEETSLETPSNLLFVCHHWFQVALQTPQLWTSWGDSVVDWKRRYTSPIVSELHLELNIDGGYRHEYPSKPLLDALQDRAARDFIRRVSFQRQEAEVLNAIIPAITAPGEGIPSIGLESFELYTKRYCHTTVKLSDFFARYRFPKLQQLLLWGRFELLPWNLLAERTGALVRLLLTVLNGWPVPTASQLISILSSNPNLQRLELCCELSSNFDSDKSSLQVELPHLKSIQLSGDCRDVLKFLNRLRPADKVDLLQLYLSCKSTPDISQTFALFLWDHLQRRGGLPGLAVEGECLERAYTLSLDEVEKLDDCRPSKKTTRFMRVSVLMGEGAGPQGEEECGKLFFDSLAYIYDHIVHLTSKHRLLKSTDASIEMTNLVEIRITQRVSLSEWFVEPDLGGSRSYGQILPSLKYLYLFGLEVDGGDWTPLTTFLSRRASAGNRLELLEISPDCPHICPDVAEEVKKLVGNFECRSDSVSPCLNGMCPIGT
jgi:hypothetical protein